MLNDKFILENKQLYIETVLFNMQYSITDHFYKNNIDYIKNYICIDHIKNYICIYYIKIIFVFLNYVHNF